MKKGDWVYTPRFCRVQIAKVFRNEEIARKFGFTEPTHYQNFEYGVCGKSVGKNEMIFAAYKK